METMGTSRKVFKEWASLCHRRRQRDRNPTQGWQTRRDLLFGHCCTQSTRLVPGSTHTLSSERCGHSHHQFIFGQSQRHDPVRQRRSSDRMHPCGSSRGKTCCLFARRGPCCCRRAGSGAVQPGRGTGRELCCYGGGKSHDQPWHERRQQDSTYCGGGSL